MPPIISSLAEISDRYDVLYCDLWGCLHDGTRAFPAAVDALRAFKAKGGTVILVTNSPRPRSAVRTQLAQLSVPDDCYDDIASSGDAAQAALAAGQFGRKVHHLGPSRDLVFFQAEDGSPIDVERVPLEQAESIVCTGLLDDRSEDPEDYRLTLMRAKQAGLDLLCANPDVIVDVGEMRIYCAGALAALYTELGGRSFYFGKPHPPIYALAQRRAEAVRGAPIQPQNILCIGDGITTDIQGGISEGLDSLFITGGLAASETGTAVGDPAGQPKPAALETFLNGIKLSPTASIGRLR
ncbi:MAG: TIGR01459 family HAD-type hydrolase [Pseudomonadota bacterium]